MYKYLLVLIILSLLIISCGEKNDDIIKLSDKEKYSFDSTDLKTDGVEISGKPFLMEYGFKKGDKYSYRLTTVSNNSQSITIDSTMSSGVEQKIIYLFDLNVKDIDDEGITEAEIKINSLKLDATANGQKFEFEAGKDNDTAKIKQFAEFYSLYNNAFSIRFTKKGEVLEIFKADKISNKFLELRGAADTISVNERNMVRQELISGVLQPLITQIIRKTPEKEVYKDSTWQINQAPIPFMVYQINYVNKYNIESVVKLNDNRVAVINAGIDFKYSGESRANQGNIFYTFQKPISTAEGKIYFDVDRGLQIRTRSKTRLEISYTMEANSPQGKQKGMRKDVVSNTNILELID